MLAHNLISLKKIKMIHEDYLFQMMSLFHETVEKVEKEYKCDEELFTSIDKIKDDFHRSVQRISTK